MTDEMTTTTPEGRSFERPVLRLLERLKQRCCSHRFAIEDLAMVNRDSDGEDRVRWRCDKCGKVFNAHCGLDISPANGPTYRRGSLQNTGNTSYARRLHRGYTRKRGYEPKRVTP